MQDIVAAVTSALHIILARKDGMQRSQNAAVANQVAGTGQTLRQLIELQELTGSCPGETRVKRQIDELRAAIPVELLRAFDSAAEHGRAAVALVTDSGACGGCHLKLPSGMATKVQVLSDRIQKCPYCGCFLCSSMALPSPEPLIPPLSSSWRPGRSIRVFRPGSASRSKARACALLTAAPDAVDSKQQDTAL